MTREHAHNGTAPDHVPRTRAAALQEVRQRQRPSGHMPWQKRRWKRSLAQVPSVQECIPLVQEGQIQQKYRSDLTEVQWAIVESLLLLATQSLRGRRPRQVHIREVRKTLVYLHRRGCPWERVPHDGRPTRTVSDSWV